MSVQCRGRLFAKSGRGFLFEISGNGKAVHDGLIGRDYESRRFQLEELGSEDND